MLKPSFAHMFPGLICRIYMVISQELISLMDLMGSSKKTTKSVILLWFILLNFTL